MSLETTMTISHQLTSICDINSDHGSCANMIPPNVIPLGTSNSLPIRATLPASLHRRPAANIDTVDEVEEFRGQTKIDLEVPFPVTDRDLLVKLLSRGLPLSDAALATIALLERYGSYAEAVAAPFDELRGINPLGEVGADLLKCVYAATLHLASAPMQRLTGVNNWKDLLIYLNTSVSRAKNEVLRILFLNSKNLVISDQMIAEGNVSAVNVCVREIVQKALQLGAAAILMIHNHPSGDPMPSPEDWKVTEKTKKALALFDITLHDHIIVGKGLYFSVTRMAFLGA